MIINLAQVETESLGVAARLGLARHYAALADRFLEIEDYPGARYAMCSFVAYATAAGEAWRDLSTIAARADT